MSGNACELYICLILISHGCAFCLVINVPINHSMVQYSIGVRGIVRNKSRTRELLLGFVSTFIFVHYCLHNLLITSNK
jgi:hypothetical protein